MANDDIYEPRRTPTTRQVELRGVEYALTEWGDASAPLLVCLHGFGDFRFLLICCYE